MQTKQDPREPVLLMALKIILHDKLCLSVIIFLICVCWHLERMCRVLFFGCCYSYGPQQGPDRQQKKEEGGLKQRKLLKETQNQGKKTREKKRSDPSRVQS